MALQRKPTLVPAWHLVDQSDLLAVLGDLTAQGWRGSLVNTGSTWQLELNADSPTRQLVVTLGDWIVDDNGIRKLSAQQVAENYDEVAGS